MKKSRFEEDSLGKKAIPLDAYYGIETLRAVENFPISGLRVHPELVAALGLIKKACARTNISLRRLEKRRGRAIIKACDEILAGRLRDQFVTDAFHSGAGVSLHMNTNEVIANRALEILHRKKGDYAFVNPHDHVNMGQSTNDVIPTAIRLAALNLLKSFYLSSQIFEKSLERKSREFWKVIKSGRTHLQDAAPVTLGQEFSGWARQIQKSRERIENLAQNLLELGIGGSAVGTGLNTTLAYRRAVISNLRDLSGFPVKSAKNLFEVMQSDADLAAASGGLRDYALCLIQISHDLRLLSSGPRTGFAEINLPPRQPGSSIMPGKVNPVMPEVSSQVAFQVVGNDLAIAFAVSSGQLELNVMRPVIAHNLLQSIELLKNVTRVLSDFCIRGITANKARCRAYAEASPGIAAVLNPIIGYSKAARCVQESIKTGKSLREILLERHLLTPHQIDRILSPANLTQPRASEH